MSYQIQPVTSTDYQEIVDLWESSVRATHHFLPESDIQYFKPLILDQYLDLVNLSCVRDLHGKIIGFSGIADGKIEMLFIHPDWFGKGVGKCLLLDAIHRQKAIEVDVNEQNEQAVSFYKHVGFEMIDYSPLDGLGKPYPLLSMHFEIDKINFALTQSQNVEDVLDMMEEFNAGSNYSFDRSIALQNLKELLENDHLGRIWLIKYEQLIVGYVILTFGFSFEYGGRDGFMDELFILRDYRGKSIGKTTIDFINRQAKRLSVKAVHLEVEKQNERAYQLYVQKGFIGNDRSLLTKRF